MSAIQHQLFDGDGSAAGAPAAAAAALVSLRIQLTRDYRCDEIRAHRADRRRRRKSGFTMLRHTHGIGTLARRLGDCQMAAIRPNVELCVKEDGTAYIRGLATCGSVWCCEDCSERAALQRKEELDTLLKWARGKGYTVVMLSLTARHNSTMRLAEFLAQMKDAKQRFRQSRTWRSVLGPRFIGSVTATEITHGKSGWHPHFHEIIILDMPAHEAVPLMRTLDDCWLYCLRRVGLDGLAERAYQVQDASVAGAYVAKFGVAEELTLNGVKQGRGGSRTPWQLLDDATNGDNDAERLWVEYAQATFRRKLLTWSPGLKTLAGVAEVSDAEASDTEVEPVVIVRAWQGPSAEWLAARKRIAALVAAAQRGHGLELDAYNDLLDQAEFGPTDESWWEATYGSE